jgi:endoglycosylceramidase
MKVYFIIVLSLICLAASKLRIDKNSLNFIDDEGRVVVLHGGNVVYKLPPYTPISDKFDPLFSFNDKDFEYFKQFGFNAVRLGISWEGLETSEGVYSEEYLNKTEELIKKFQENNIYVLLDAHQDMFSRKFCGEGVPLFYANKLSYDTDCNRNLLSKILGLVGLCIPLKTHNWEYDDQGLPIIEKCRKGFNKYFQSPEVITNLESFYSNQNNVLTSFIEFWKVVVTRFGKFDNIIGYDLWNEPLGSRMFSDLKYVIPGYATNHQILPFLKKIDAELRKIQSDFVLYFEGANFPDTFPIFGGRNWGGYNTTPLGKDNLDKQVLNVHSYCCLAWNGMCDEYSEPSLEDSKTTCKTFHKRKVHDDSQRAKKLGVPFIITEFGACSDSEACYNEIMAVVEPASEINASWMYWNYKPYGDPTTSGDWEKEGIFYKDGSVQPAKVKSLTRTYIQRYQGVPIYSKFDDLTGRFESKFKLDAKLPESILYFNKEVFYKTGVQLNFLNQNGEKINTFTLNNSEDNYFKFKINGTNHHNEEIIVVLESQ